MKIVMNSRVRSLYSYSKKDLNKVSRMRDLVFYIMSKENFS